MKMLLILYAVVSFVVSAFRPLLSQMLFPGLVDGLLLVSAAFFGDTSLAAHSKEGASFEWCFPFFD